MVALTIVTRALVLAIAVFVVALAGAVVLPAPARAAAEPTGCAVLGDVRDRAECEARAAAREEARAEVDRQLGERGDEGSGATVGAATRSADWQAAVDEANAFDASAILEPRPVAAVVGLTWFFLAVRARRRARARARS
jgi:hypothetical protein